MSLVAASTGQDPLFRIRRFELQQLSKSSRAGLMHRRTHRQLDDLQIHASGLAAILEHYAEELV